MVSYSLIITKMAARIMSTRMMLPVTMRFEEGFDGAGEGVALGSGCGFGCGFGSGWGLG
jgi:hypothetical protein